VGWLQLAQAATLLNIPHSSLADRLLSLVPQQESFLDRAAIAARYHPK
jgi:hypothetical protein